MNEKIYTYQSENIKASWTWLRTYFGSESYIGQYTHICLRPFSKSLKSKFPLDNFFPFDNLKQKLSIT